MKFAVFGATGRVGRHVLTAALDAGHSVSVLVRDTRRLPVIARSGLTIREGAVDDPSLVAATLAGADACICCLAAGNNLLTRFGRVAIPQLEHSGPRRLVVLAGASLRRPEDPPAVSLAVMSTIMRMVPGRMLDDVAGLVRQLEASPLDWTVVRSANHTDAPVGPVHAAAGFQMKMSATVSRQALAAFLLAIAGDGRFIREAPMVEAANVS